MLRKQEINQSRLENKVQVLGLIITSTENSKLWRLTYECGNAAKLGFHLTPSKVTDFEGLESASTVKSPTRRQRKQPTESRERIPATSTLTHRKTVRIRTQLRSAFLCSSADHFHGRARHGKYSHLSVEPVGFQKCLVCVPASAALSARSRALRRLC